MNMTYEEFLFSQLAMDKINMHSTTLKQLGYDELFPLIEKWYISFLEFDKLSNNQSLYERMQEYVSENIG